MDPIVKELKRRLEGSSYRRLAAELGVSSTDVHNVVHGRRPPGERLLQALGFEKRVTTRYVKAIANGLSLT